MQSCSGDEGAARIITASNINKKLSFQGWDKCIEVFSQGKGHLSHRCSQLIPDVEPFPYDQTISWSSSEEEVEEDNLQIPRPRRTLSSRINFDDCKRVRHGRRRHSSAQFVRSIEKHSKSSFRRSTCDSILDDTENIGLSYTSVVTVSQHKDISPTGSESFDKHHLVNNNLSILNKRVNVTADCSLEFSSYPDLNNSEVGVPSDKTFEEKVETSPILASRLPKKKKAKGNKISVKAESIKKDSVSQKLTLSPSPSSPILKPSFVRRKSGQRALKCTLPTNREGVTIRSVTENDEKTLDCKRIGTCLVNNEAKPVFLSPPNQKNVAEPAVSPVIGTCSGRRRKPVSMPIDKSISPILGSKLKSACPPKVQEILTSPSIKLSALMNERNEEHCFSEEGSELGPSIPNIDLLIEFLNGDIGDQSKPELTPRKATAKRSLHFSPQIKSDKKEIHQCVNGIKDQADVDEQVWDKMESQPQAMTDELNQSSIIEEINTEQMDISDFPSKSALAPFHVPKKKKLSLKGTEKSNFPNIKVINKKLNLDSVVISDAHMTVAIVDTSSQTPCREDKQKKIGILDGQSKKETEVLKHSKSPSCAKAFADDTFFIEEESSEPMSLPSQNVFLSPKHLSRKPQTKTSTSAKNSCKPGSDNERWKKKIDCDMDIDSCSSQSSEKIRESQSDQIERLVSPSLSSPMTISQASSPPAPAGGFQIEEKTDDFNAPPRKGKMKLKPDGLANRLHRLLNRQRSSSRIWQFKRNKQNKTESSPASSSQRHTSMLLIIERTWTECSHVLVQGYLADESVRACLNSSSRHVVVVVDPTTAENLGKIMSSSQIRIFPPWQALKLRGITLILCAYCIEVVSSDLTCYHLMSQRKILEESFPVKDGLECVSGLSFFDIIFPKFEEKHTRLLQCTENNISHQLGMLADVPNCLNTISYLVSNHYTGKAASSSLSLTVLEVFRYKQDDVHKSKADSPSWAVLAQDTAGEVCEVVLGCEEAATSERRSIWEDLTSGNAIGNTYIFSGFAPVQRISPFRVSNPWRVTSNMDIPGISDQPVFYLLGALTSSWDCKSSGHLKKSCINQPQFSLLSNVAPEVPYAEPKRLNAICRVLHASSERLYIIDKSTLSQIKVVTLNSMVDVPPFPFKTSLAVIFHLEIDGAGELRADKYSRISFVDCKSSLLVNNLYDKKELEDLANLKLILPPLQKTSVAKTLVTFVGSVVGVDEDSAFMWPACGVCKNELLSLGNNSEQYRCEKCDNQCDNFTLLMSLEVLATSPNLSPKSSIRLKLIQSTIESLLPPTLCNKEGYDMNAVLGCTLGPMGCEILHVKENNFTLQELSRFAIHT